MKQSFRASLPRALLASCMALINTTAWAQASAANPPYDRPSRPLSTSSPRGANADAPSQGRPRSETTGSYSRADQQFVSKAMAAGQAEVEMARLAQTRAQNDEVKIFASRMVDEHTRMNSELRSMGAAHGLPGPEDAKPTGSASSGAETASPRPSAAGQHDMERLQSASGANFDREFMKQMVADHKSAVAEFQRAASLANDSELKSFAQRTLAGLQEHLQQARHLNDRVAGTTQR